MIGTIRRIITCVWLLSHLTHSQDPECTNGIISSGWTPYPICCAASCGACGGSTCPNRPGGSGSCCLFPIRDGGISCYAEPAPCNVGLVYEPTTDPTTAPNSNSSINPSKSPTITEPSTGPTANPTLSPNTATPTKQPTETYTQFYNVHYHEPLTWYDADNYCKYQYNTSLASIHSSEENEQARILCDSIAEYPYLCYIGLNDFENERNTSKNGWVWNDGSDYNYQNWYPSQPENPNEDCVDIHPHDGKWSSTGGSTGCWYKRYFLCNLPIIEPSENYIVGLIKMSWNDANNYCQSEYGTTLASIHTAEENEEAWGLCDRISKHEDDLCFIGLNDIDNEKAWLWSDNSVYIYENWADDQPNDGYGEDCTMMRINGWNDYSCDNAGWFLCNRHPTPTPEPTTDPTDEPPCVLYDDDYISDKGENIMGTIQADYGKYDLSNDSIEVYNGVEQCNGNQSNICFVWCTGERSCVETTITPQNGISLDILQIKCKENACRDVIVNIDDSMVGMLNIICDGKFACESWEIEINAASSIQINIECNYTWSCYDLHVYLNNTDDSKVTELVMNVSCYNDFACNDMNISTSGSLFTFITMNMFRYSQNIFIQHYHPENIDINCGNEEEQIYIKYRTTEIPKEYELLLLAQRQMSSNMLPCLFIINII